VRQALRFLGNLLRIGLLPLWLLARRSGRPRSRWVQVRLDPHPVEIDGSVPLLQRLLQPRAGGRLRSIAELRRLLDLLAQDERIDGVVLQVPHLHCGFATCQSLRDALAAFRARGKRSVAYLSLGGGNREVYVALSADRVFAPPQASLSLLGAASQSLYFKPLLERIGLQAEVLAHGEYKTAAEAVLRESMSEPQREQVTALLDVVQRELESAVAGRPGFDAARARGLFERGIWAASAAVEEGLIDGCCYEDQLPALIAATDAPGAPPISHRRYLLWRTGRLWRRVRRLPQIAVVRVHGAIASTAPRVPTSRVATFESIAAALRRARANGRVHGVLLHVDSPGGSALASDLIHREIVLLREKKPVVACLGDVAASGGYYVAAPCNRIVAQATTVTGSIGVVSLRLIASDLADRLGVRPQTVLAAPHADLHSPFRALTEEERALLWAESESIYRSFVSIVAEGRKRSTEEIDRVARGRVWAGADALHHGLIDEIGGFECAVAALRELSPVLRGLSDAELEVSVLSPGRGELPAAAPTPAPAASDLHRAFGVPSAIGDVASLHAEGERALYYGAVPEIR
jgi:protease IV